MKTLEVVEAYGKLGNYVVEYVMKFVVNEDLKKPDTELNVDYNNATQLAIVCLRRPEDHEIRELFQIAFEELDEFIENKNNVGISPADDAAAHDAEVTRLAALSESPPGADGVLPENR